MEESEKPSDMDQLYQLLLSFQCQRIPFDLISRASEPKLSWSATGEIEQIHPHEGGVPRWLLDLREARQWPFDHDDGAAAPDHDSIRLLNDCGIRYLEVQPIDALEADEYEQSQEEYASQCIRIFSHAFPCRNTEILGEEVAARLMPLTKAFLLPLLASASENDIQVWLLPKERTISFAIGLFDCLLQVLTSLGPHSSLYPTSFPRKMVNAINTPTAQAVLDCGVEPCLTVVLELIEAISSSSLGAFERLASNIACGDLDERSNAWAGLVLMVLLSSQTATRPQPKALSDAIAKAAASWYPKSTTIPSPMEYLVAIELLPHAQLRSISLPESLRVGTELSILRGLLLSRMQYHDEASIVFYDNMPAAISRWGPASFQIGIIAAESANSYNVLRKEHIANKIATRFLTERKTPELTSRQDWFYLNVSLIDSLIGSGRYAEAESSLEHLISQPSVTPTIHMMGCLRLSKIRRRILTETQTVESHHSLREGINLFRQVPNALREEYLEEVACILSATMTATQKSLEAKKGLMDDIDSLLKQTGQRESPAQKRYAQAQIQFKQHALPQENSATVSGHKPGQLRPTRSVNDDAVVHLSDRPPHIIYTWTTPVTDQRVISIPYKRDDHFIPRPEVAQMMRSPKPGGEPIKVYSVHGEAGIGKTSFVTDFAHNCINFCGVIAWIKNSPLDDILGYLSSIAVELELKEPNSSTPIHQDQALEQLFEWFKCPRQMDLGDAPWLMVFDGIEDEEVLRQIWPTGGRIGVVIVITREPPLFLAGWDIDWNGWFNLRPLHPKGAEELALNLETEFLVSGGHISSSGGITTNTARSLVDLLQYHPAAIKQASTMIHGEDMQVDDFIQKYKEIQGTYLSPSAVNQIIRQPNHNLALITLWLMEARSTDFFLLHVICLLSGVGIDECLISDELPKKGYPLGFSEFAEMRDQLLESSLIWKRHGQHSLCTSTAVQAIFRERMSSSSFQGAFYRALLVLCQSWPCKSGDLYSIDYGLPTHLACSKLWSHVCNLSEQLHRFDPTNIPHFEILQVSDALLNISWCAIAYGLHHYASLFLELVSRILRLRVDRSFRSDLELTRQQCLLNHHEGRLAYSQGLSGKAIACFRRCFVLAVNELGPGSEDYWSFQAAAQQGLGDVHRKATSFKASIIHYEMSIKALTHVGNKAGQHLSTVRISLGLSLLFDKQPEAAESVLEQAHLSQSAIGIGDEISNTPRNLALFLGLAIAKLVQGKAEESLQLASECLSNSLSSFSQESNAASVVHLVMSVSYGRLSKFDPALEHLDQAREACRSKSGYQLEAIFLERQQYAYELMCQGTKESLKLEAFPGLAPCLDEDGFLHMHFLVTHFKHYILDML